MENQYMAEPQEINNSNPSERLQTEQTESNSTFSSFSKQEFEKWLFLASTYLITFLLLLLWQKVDIPLVICFIPSVLSDLFTIFKSLLSLRIRKEDYEKRLILKDIIENIGTSSTKLMVIIYLQLRNFPLIFSLVPLSLSTLGNISIKSISFNKCQIFSEIMFIMLRVVRLLTCVSIFFRIDNFYNFDWSLTFWPIWSFISIIGLVTLGLFFFSLGLYVDTRLYRVQISGSIYLILSLLVSMIVFTLFFISLASQSPNFYPPLIFLILFVFFSYFLRNYLLLSLTQFLTFDPDSRVVQITQITPERREHTSFISVISNTPKFLVKLSSSYFKQVPSNLRPAKKRTSSVAVVPVEQLFHRRSITSEEFTKKQKKVSDTNMASIDVEKCLTCMEKISNAVIMNCGHGGICFECASKLHQDVGTCHICRGDIEVVVRVLQYPNGIHEVITESEPA